VSRCFSSQFFSFILFSVDEKIRLTQWLVFGNLQNVKA